MFRIFEQLSSQFGNVLLPAAGYAASWLGLRWVLGIWFVGICFILASAYLLQKRLIVMVQRREEEGAKPRSMFYLEFMGFAGAIIPPLMLIQWIRATKEPEEPEGAKDDGAVETASEDVSNAKAELEAAAATKPPRAWLVPSLGPSYLIASYTVIGLFVLGEWLKFPVASVLGIESYNHVWNALFFGKNIHGGLFITMRGVEPFALAFTATAWTLVWMVVAMVVRLSFSRALTTHGALPEEIRRSKLRWWREWLGMRGLTRVDDTVLSWAWWAFTVLVLVGVLSIFLYAARQFPLRPETVVVGVLVILGWLLHLTLKGAQAGDVEAEEEKEEKEVNLPVPGWDAFVDQLKEEFGVKSLSPIEGKSIGRSQVARASEVEASGISSILLQELQAGTGQRIEPTQMQVSVLKRLFEGQTPSHVGAKESSDIGIGSSSVQSYEDERHQLYVASAAGSGKSTLAMLAAMNHVLVHSQAVLIVASSAKDAADLAKRLRNLLDPSPLRWTIQVRLAGDDLVHEAIKGTVPDIIVCDLEWLTLSYLGNEPQMSGFTESLGLIIVDDADAYQGAQAVHAQLSFARLNLSLSRSLAARNADRMRGHATSMLVLSSVLEESYLSSAKTLVKRELTPISFQEPEPSGSEVLGVRQFLDLNDFVDSRGDQLLFRDLVDACEKAEVPWTYWRAGARKEERTRLRHQFSIPPRLMRTNPLEAAIVFVEGRFTHVQREFRRLGFAGIDYLGQPIQGTKAVTFIRMVDRDEQMAFDVRDGGGTLSKLIRRLPMPLVHVPGRAVNESHMTAELNHRSMELKEVLECFGEDSLLRVRELAARGRMTVEPRTLLASGGQEFHEAVYVKARARAVFNSQDPEQQKIQGVRLLEPPPTQVRHNIDHPVKLYDRVSLSVLDEVDPLVANFRFFPFAAHNTSGQQWIVMERVGGVGMHQYRNEVRQGDVVLEPYGEDWVSVPERRLRFVPHLDVEAEPIQYGELPLRVAQITTNVQGDHLGTRYVDPERYLVQQRRRLLPEDGMGVYTSQDRTDALVIHVASLWRDVDPSLHEPLRALFVSAVRMSLGLTYESADHGMDVALMAKEFEEEQEWLTFFELSVGGSGAIRALARDGLESLLRLTRLIVERVLNHDRLLARYNDRPMLGVAEESPSKGSEDTDAVSDTDDLEEYTVPIFKPAKSDEKRELEKRLRELLLKWLDERLMPEAGSDVFEDGRTYPNGYELGEAAESDFGRAWVTSTKGVSDLRWTRLHWFAPRHDQRREADIGMSSELLIEMGERRNQLTQEELERLLLDVEARNETSLATNAIQQADAALAPLDDTSTDVGDDGEPATLLAEDDRPRVLPEPKKRSLWARTLRCFTRRKGKQELLGADDASETASEELSMRAWPRGYGYAPGRLATAHGFSGAPLTGSSLTSGELRWLVALQLSAGKLLEDAVPVIESLAELVEANLHQLAANDPLGRGLVDAQDALLAEAVMLASSLVSERGGVRIAELPPPLAPLTLEHPVRGLHHGETNNLTGALIVALFHAYWERPAGIFVNLETKDVLAALHLHSGGGHSAFEVVGRWREMMLLDSNTSAQARRRTRGQRAVTVRLSKQNDVMVAIDLLANRSLSTLTKAQQGPWIYLPLYHPSEEQP